jgi:hypothetical protein
VEAHRFRRDFLISSRAGADLPTRPEPLLPFRFIQHDYDRAGLELVQRHHAVASVMMETARVGTLDNSRNEVKFGRRIV